ncbi:hypothetical protein O3M35_011786 [Rhynocoris fuscipes]|uniref:Uncharacterized protein n=1 Tax=Rhynocoris fuscipes TaxID=488301 RepID=A0AAW1CWH6_9HEMI
MSKVRYYYTRSSMAIERGCNKHFSQELNITFFLQPFTNNIVFSNRKMINIYCSIIFILIAGTTAD